MKTSPQKGFTLIELMIVVAIIGILAAIAIPKFAQMLEKSREGATKGNMGALHSAIAIYQGDSLGQIPNNLLDWFSTGGSIAYIDNIPPVRPLVRTPRIPWPAIIARQATAWCRPPSPLARLHICRFYELNGLDL